MASSGLREAALDREAAKAMFPMRVGYGVVGTRFAAVGNNYEMLTLPTDPFYHYDVEITTRPAAPGVPPKAVPKRLYKRIIVNAMTRNPQIFPKRGSFDGNRNLYVPVNLGIPDGQWRSLPAGLDGEDDGNPNPFTVKLTRVGKVDVKSLAQLVLSGQTIADPQARAQALRDMSSAVMVLNAVVQMVGKELYRDEAGRKSTVYFRPRKEMPSGVRWLELWQGYYQSIRPKIKHLTVNIDVTHGLMYTEGPLLDLVISYMKTRDARELTPGAIGSTSKLQRLLKGLLVIVKRNQTTRSRARPIVAVVKIGARDCMFTNRRGEHLSVEEYYRQTYQTTIRFPTIVCVAVGNPKSVVPLELCHVVPGQLFKGVAPREVMQTTIKTASQKPRARLDAVKQAYKDLQYKNSDFIRQSGMVIDTAPMKLSGRRLEPPVLWCGKGQSAKVADDGSFTMAGKEFFAPARVETLAVLCFLAPRDNPEDVRRAVFDFCKRLGTRLKNMGLTGPGLEPEAFYVRQASQGGNVLEYAADVIRHFGGNRPSLLLAILPGTLDVEHVAVKRAGDVELGIATQVVLTERIVGNGLPKDDYVRNLAAKINLKLGGMNWVLGRAILPGYVAEKNYLPTTIIIGADASHPPPGNLTSPSICGVVATLDRTLVKYCGVSSVQTGGQRAEVIEGLKGMLKPIFERFRKEHVKDWPTQVIYYRDGVGESQLAEVTRVEKQAIMEALREAQLEMKEPGAPKPLLTFVVVSKRHHQRFFPDHGDRNGNCFAGSVFDEGVASPTLFDFYLQSHAAIQGTARPAHYVVTHNENPIFNADSLQEFTHNLCHTYGRVTRSVSIPPPVYYADLLCRRGKFMFPPGLDFDDGASAASGQGEAALLQFYQSQYARIHEGQRDKMYFV